MTIEQFLHETVVVLGASVAVVLASHWLRVPAIVALLLTGMLVGPSGLGLVGEPERVELFAEIGVVFLLFSIGLELPLERLRELRRAFLGGGALQTGLTVGAVAAAALGLGMDGARATFFGFVVALSSTAIVLKLYNERRETAAPHGRLAMGILLFQDVAMVPMIVLTPALAGGGGASPAAMAGRFLAAVAVVAVVVFAAHHLVPRLLDHLARTRVRELLLLGGLVACLGMAVLTASLGFSLALGAFVAGIIVSGSQASHQVVADVAPLRDLFTSVFFISIGMLLDLPFALEHAGSIAALAAGIVVVKALATGGAVAALGFPLRIAAVTALGLAQIGEFSFVLLAVGRTHGLVETGAYQHLIGASVLTMLAAPLLIAAAPALAARLAAALPGPSPAPAPPARRNHTLIIGYGPAGQTLARVIRTMNLPYTVVELNGATVREAARAGEPIIYGDSTRREVLEAAGAAHAGVIVLVISDLEAVRRTIPVLKQLNPAAHVLVRTRQQAHIEALTACGADEVVAEEFETTIELLTRVLRHHHVPRNVVLAETRLLRGETYRMLRAEAADPAMSETLLRVLAAGTTDLFQVEPDSPLVGQSMRELDLRRRAGATVIAVVRGEQPLTNPPAQLRIEPNDILVLVGSHADIEQAFVLLERSAGGHPPESPA